MQRTKTEIKRDYEYLQGYGANKELTLNLSLQQKFMKRVILKRSIRDLYNRDIDEVLVEGEGLQIAKDFMRMIGASHSKNVKHYNDPFLYSPGIKWKLILRRCLTQCS